MRVFLGYIEGHQDDYDKGMAKIVHAIDTATQLQDAEIRTNGHLLAGRLCVECERPDQGRAHLTIAKECAEDNELLAMLPHIETLLESTEP